MILGLQCLWMLQQHWASTNRAKKKKDPREDIWDINEIRLLKHKVRLDKIDLQSFTSNISMHVAWIAFTFDQDPTVQAKGHALLKHDLKTGGFSVIIAHASSFNATCSSFPELLTQSTDRIEMPFPHDLEHFCHWPFHHLKLEDKTFPAIWQANNNMWRGGGHKAPQRN